MRAPPPWPPRSRQGPLRCVPERRCGLVGPRSGPGRAHTRGSGPRQCPLQLAEEPRARGVETELPGPSHGPPALWPPWQPESAGSGPDAAGAALTGQVGVGGEETGVSWSPLLPSLRGGACSEPEASAQSGSHPWISLETQRCPPPAPLIDRSPERFPHPADRPTRVVPEPSPPCVFREGRPSFPETPQVLHSLFPGGCEPSPEAGVVKSCFGSGCAVGADLVSTAAGGQGPCLQPNMAALGDSDGPETQARPGHEGLKPRLPGVPQPHWRWLGACGPDPWPPSLLPWLPPGVGVKPQGRALGLVEPGEHGQMAG